MVNVRARSIERREIPMKVCVTGAQKAREELGFQSRPLDDTIEWYRELIAAGAFDGARGSGLSRIADSMRIASRLGLLTPIRMGQRVVGRRIVAGG
jgi:hypothetical protein